MQQTMLMGLATLLAVASGAPTISELKATPISVPVVTKYITTEVQTVEQDETMVLIGQLCEQSKGMLINVSVLLNNNPDWDPTFGVVRYYVVDSVDKTLTDALCYNVVKGVAGPCCSVKSWPGTNDLYIKFTAGQSSAISFTLDAEITNSAGNKYANMQPRANTSYIEQQRYEPKVSRAPVYLTEIVTIATNQPLGYRKTALLNFTFCPTPRTGKSYEVRGTTTASDGQSSYAQYICDKLPCVVDGVNVIAHNGRQLPSNSVVTASGQWKTLYALVVCWGGVYDKGMDEYIGRFLFTANQL